jgi:chorismate synthase
MSIEIKPLNKLEELAQVVEVQASFWNNPAAVVSQSMLWSLVNNGGSVIGALEGERVVGFVMGYIGLAERGSGKPARDNLKLVSQRMAILPEYRQHGIGYQLKLAQRDYALEQDIDLITWTFDPLISRNAYLNLHKLGGRVCRYLIDYYGTNAAMTILGSSDRLLVEWWVKEEQTAALLEGRGSRRDFADYVAETMSVNPTRVTGQGFVEPTGDILDATADIVLFEIPHDFGVIAAEAPVLGMHWRQHCRLVLLKLLEASYSIRDFVYGPVGDVMKSYYVLVADGIAGSWSSGGMSKQ